MMSGWSIHSTVDAEQRILTTAGMGEFGIWKFKKERNIALCKLCTELATILRLGADLQWRTGASYQS